MSSHFPPCASVTPVTPCCNYLSYWDHVSSWFIFSVIPCLAPRFLKIHWVKLAFQVSRRNDLSVLYLPGFLSILLYFFSLFLSLSGFSHWMSESPGPLHHGQPGWGPGLWPGPVDLQRGGCGHWEGGCFAPTHPAAFSTLPCECLPLFPKTPLCPWLTVCNPGFLLGHQNHPHLVPLCLSTCNFHGMFSRLGSVCPYFLYSLLPSFQNAVLLPAFAFGSIG